MSEHNLSRRKATPDDIPFLLELRESTMSAQLVAAGIELSTKETLTRVMHKFECADVVLLDGKPVGVIKVSQSEKQWKIDQIQLIPSTQGKGLGTNLLKTVIEQATTAGATLTLSVLKKNPAKRLYESLGFTTTGSDDHEYFMELDS